MGKKSNIKIEKCLVSDLNAIDIELSRKDFLEYRMFMNPKLKVGWWVIETAIELQAFYNDLIAGKKPILILEAPPQHGKSIMVIDFMAWICGKHPELRTIFSSFSDRLGKRANLKLQRAFLSERYQAIFPDLQVSGAIKDSDSADSRYARNSELIEFFGGEGYFRNTTVEGAITGESLDLAVIDDPIKGRKAANSVKVRDNTWDWLTDDLFTRFSEDAGLLLMLTRWHIDDPAARLLMYDKTVKVLSYKAIAEYDEKNRKQGEPLFPELKSLEFLNKRKLLLTKANWLSLYQQDPVISGGDLIKTGNIEIVEDYPKDIKKFVRYWDKAGTKDGGAYTAGVLIGITKDKVVYIIDVVRGQWSALARENKIKQTAELDGTKTHIWVEQEPGSGGKESAENTVRNLVGFVIKVEKVTGDKVTRAEPYAAQVEAGNVKVVKSDWTKAFIDEMEVFPNGKYKDQVDAAAGGFNKLAVNKRYGFTDKQKRANMRREKTTEAPCVDEEVW